MTRGRRAVPWRVPFRAEAVPGRHGARNGGAGTERRTAREARTERTSAKGGEVVPNNSTQNTLVPLQNTFDKNRLDVETYVFQNCIFKYNREQTLNKNVRTYSEIHLNEALRQRSSVFLDVSAPFS